MPVPTKSPSLVILPSENQTREFDAKLLLACVLAERGHKVVVGARHVIHNRIADFSPGIYVAKDFRKPSERILALIAGLGHHIVAWDEEGLVQPQAQLYYDRRYSLKAITNVRSCFAWGPTNKQLMEVAPHWPKLPIHETGNPRIDFLRPDLRGFHAVDVARLQNEYGKFVLFDSNFASFNPALQNGVSALFDKGAPLSLYLQGRKRLFERWQKLVPNLAKAIAPAKLVIRPHPAESHTLWKNIAALSPNIIVAHEGSALAWILASEVMLHSGCTTGLEAAFMGHVPIAFRPENLTELGRDLPDSLSIIAKDENEMQRLVLKRLKTSRRPKLTKEQERLANTAAYARSGPLASDRIANELAKLSPINGRKIDAQLRARMRQVEKWFMGLNASHKTSAANNALRYPGISFAEVTQRIARLGRALNRFHGIAAKSHTPQIYVIEKTSENGTTTPARTGDL